MTGRCRLPAPAAGRLCLRRGAFPRPPRPRRIWRLLRQPQHSSAPYMGWTIARALSSRLEKAPPRRLHRETVASFRTPFGVTGLDTVSYTHLTLPTNREV